MTLPCTALCGRVLGGPDEYREAGPYRYRMYDSARLEEPCGMYRDHEELCCDALS